MQCDNCGKREAVIQLTQVENNEMRVLHLCEDCAAERGVEVDAQKTNAPLADFLAAVMEIVSPSQPRAAVSQRMCISSTGCGFAAERRSRWPRRSSCLRSSGRTSAWS